MEQRTPEWHAARAGRITASMVGAILGQAPYMTRAEAMRTLVRAREGAPREFTGNVATEWGTHNEDGARWEYEMETTHAVEAVGFVPFEDWAGASPDGLIGNGGLLEIKCPFGIRNDPAPAFKTLAAQEHYYSQVQFQLYCTGRTWAHFFQWTPHGTKLERVAVDPDWAADNIPILRQFYAEYLDESAEDHIGPARVAVGTPDVLALLGEYDDLADAIAQATERKAEVLAALVAEAGARDALLCGRKLTLVEKAGAVSYAKAIKALAPDANLEPYRGKPSSHWKLT